MSEEEMFEQLYDLIDDRKSLMGSDEETNFIYKKDIQAIKQIMNGYKEYNLELSGYRQAILDDKEMLGLKDENQQLKIQISAREEEYEKLEDNWNELEQFCIDEQVPEEYDEYNSYIEFSNSVYENVLNKMEKLKQGCDSNE